MFAWWLILVLVGINAVGLLASIWFVYHYVHPEDLKYNQGLMCEVVIIAGWQMFFVAFSLFFIDAYNAEDYGGWNMVFCWKLAHLAIAVFLTVVVPLTIFSYEADRDPRVTKVPVWRQISWRAALWLPATWGIIGLLYLANLNVKVPTSSCQTPDNCVVNVRTGTLDFLSFLIGLNGWVGSFMFVIAGGIGTVVLPVSAYLNWRYLPRTRSAEDYEKLKAIIGGRAKALRRAGETLITKEMQVRTTKGQNVITRANAKQKMKRQAQAFKEVSQLLTDEFARLEACRFGVWNPMKRLGALLWACVAWLLFMVVFVQILVGVLVPQMITSVDSPFLDPIMRVFRDHKIMLPDLFIYTSVYGFEVVCGVFGCVTLSRRYKALLPVESLHKKSTHCNALLFYTALMIILGCSVIVLATKSMPSYVEGSEVAFQYDLQRNYIRTFRGLYGHNVFEWFWLIVLISSGLCCVLWPPVSKPIQLDNPKTLKRWANLNKKLGIENGPGGVHSPKEDEPEEEEPETLGDRLKNKIHKVDRSVMNAPQNIIGEAIKKPWA